MVGFSMSTSLTPDQEALLERAVASGQFTSPADAMAEALAMLEERLAKHARLKRDIEFGLNSGEARHGSFRELAAELHAEWDREQAELQGRATIKPAAE